MKYLLDTDISSYVIRERSPRLREKFERHAEQLAVSVITAAELRFGAELSSHRGIAADVESFLERVPILDWTDQESIHYARLRAAAERKGTPIGALDMLIAAHAISRSMVLVTNNEKHFRKVASLKVELWA